MGYNGHGELGIGNTESKSTPHRIPISNVQSVRCGGYQTVVYTKFLNL